MIENHLSWFGHVKRKEVTIVLNNMIFSLKKRRETKKDIGKNYQEKS